HLHLAVVRHEFDHWLFERARREGVELLPAGPSRVDLFEGLIEPPQVVAAKRWDDVETARQFLGPLKDTSEAADHHVLDSPTVERLQNPVWIEPGSPVNHDRSSSRAQSGAGGRVALAKGGGSYRVARRATYPAR